MAITQTPTRFGVASQEAQSITEEAEILISERWKVLTGKQFYLKLTSKNENHDSYHFCITLQCHDHHPHHKLI